MSGDGPFDLPLHGTAEGDQARAHLRGQLVGWIEQRAFHGKPQPAIIGHGTDRWGPSSCSAVRSP